MTAPSYIGRFAPTPSGHLHFGSLVAALASYLDARAAGGRWLLRMEDLDPPREMPGAQAAILDALERYGFEWDGELVRQSERHEAYAEVLNRLFSMGLAYACTCSRKQLEAYHGIYPGLCRNAGHSMENAAIRIRVPELEYRFEDRVQGSFSQHLGREVGDFVICRRDGLYAYQLAVVLDDAAQGVTDIVRGADLLDSTPRQILLQRALGLPTPRYLHLPLMVDASGHKLAKSSAAPAVEVQHPLQALQAAWQALGQPAGSPPMQLDVASWLQAASAVFEPGRLTRGASLQVAAVHNRTDAIAD